MDSTSSSRRRKATGPSRPEESLYRAIFDCVNDAILVLDPETGALLQVNQKMRELFGYEVEEALQQDLGTLSVGLSPCALEDAQIWMRKANEEGPQTFEWLARTKKGRLFWVEMNLRRVLLDGKPHLLLTARDIKDRKRAESEQNLRLARAEAQNAVSMALAGVGPDFEAALHLIARHLASQVGDLCIVSLLDEEGLLRRVAMNQPYLDGDGYLPDLAALGALPEDGGGEMAVLHSGEALLVNDPTWNQPLALVEEAFHPYFRRFGIHSMLMVAMRMEGQSLGTLALGKGGSSRAYTSEDQAMLQNLADRAALTIANARLYAENLRNAQALLTVNAELEERVAERTAALEEANARLQQLASQDGLTGLANRRHFDAVLEAEIRRARRSGDPLALILCDVDFFKRYNDCYGHVQGDACLRAVGEVMRDVFRRAGDLPARYGGEEFAVILPGTAGEAAGRVAEKFRAAMEGRALPHERSDAAPCVTLSVGVAHGAVGPEMDAQWFITTADQALYRSKEGGRNRVTLGA